MARSEDLARLRPAGALILLAALASCRVGPDYAPPDGGNAQAWHAVGHLATARLRVDAEAAPDPAWWAALGDPALVALVERAVQANPELAAAEARMRSARALIGVAEARLLPQLGASSRIDRISLSENFPVLDRFIAAGQADREQTLATTVFDAAWELDFFGGARRRSEAATARADATAGAHRAVLLTIVAEVARNYFALRRAQQEARSFESSLELEEARVALAQARLAAGVGALPPLTEARARKEVLAARLPPVHAREAAAAYRLDVLTAQAPGTVYRAHAALQPLPEPPDLVPVGLPGDVLQRRPDVYRAERALAAATADVGVDVAGLFPSISLTGVAGFQAQSFTELFRSESATWAVGPGVRWNLLRGGALRAKLEASRAIRDGQIAAWEATVNEALADAEGALTRYARAFEARERFGAALEQGEAAVTVAEQAFAAGVVSEEAVLRARLRLQELTRAAIGAREEVLVALAALNKALGGGWPVQDGAAPEGRRATTEPQVISR